MTDFALHIKPKGDMLSSGAAVQLARRICDHAQPAQILASAVVRSDIGETELRGYEDSVRLYEVRWREDAGAQ